MATPYREECYEHAAKWAMKRGKPVAPLRVLHAKHAESSPLWEELYDRTGAYIYELAEQAERDADKAVRKTTTLAKREGRKTYVEQAIETRAPLEASTLSVVQVIDTVGAGARVVGAVVTSP
jgi:nucleotide-binding universal stress UspA family protein